MLKKWLVGMIALAVLSPAWSGIARGQEAVAGAEKEGQEENKLIKVTTLEEAFLRALQTRNVLAQNIMAKVQKLRSTEVDAEKETLRKEIEADNTNLQSIKIAMEVVFGIGNRREYEYDRVKSTIYLKVGTVEDAFARAVKTRETLREFVVAKTAEKEKAEDAETVQQLEKQIEQATRQYQLVVASLQIVFGVVPQRHYTYDPRNATLYLNVSDAEVEQLRAKVEELRKQQEEAANK